MRTFMKRLPNSASMEFDPLDAQIAAGTVHEVRQLVEEHDRYPDLALFVDIA